MITRSGGGATWTVASFKPSSARGCTVVKCPVHGCQTVAVPWAEKYARFTRLFERLAIDVMLECSITGACAILGISWNEADGIKQRAVKRGVGPQETGGHGTAVRG